MLKRLFSLINFQNILLIGYILIMTFLLYRRDVNEIDVSKYILAAFVIIVSVLSNASTLLSVILFTIPLMCGLPGNFFLPIWIVCLLLYFYRSKNHLVLPSIWFATFFIIFEFVHYAFYYYEVNYIDLASYYCSLLLICMLCRADMKIDYSRPVLAFCIGCCVLLTIVFIMFTKDGDAAMMVEMSGRMGGDKVYTGDEIMTLRSNANTIGLFSSTAISCALSLFYYKRIHYVTLFCIVAICFVFGFFSVSRTWAVVLVLMAILYVIFQRKNRWMGYVMIGVFFLCFVYFYISNPDFFALFFNRFTNGGVETGGNRTILFEAYNNFMFDNIQYFIFGTSAQFYKEVTGVFNSTHNGIQQIFVCYGVIGLILFLGAYIKLLIDNYTKKQQIALLPMICVFIFLQTLQSIWPIVCLYPIIAAFFTMKIVKQNTNQV